MLPETLGRTPPPSPRAWYAHLYVQVLLAIAVGVALGHFFPAAGVALKPLGDAFIKLVKMVIAPVIFLTIVTGIAGLRDLSSVGRIAAKAFAYFLFFSTLALVLGLLVANSVRPGEGLNIDPASLDAGKVASFAEKAHETSVVGFLTAIIPDTFVASVSEGNILQVLFVSILFGVALATIGERGARLLSLFEDMSIVFFRLVAIVMKAAPVGAFAAMAFTIGQYGIASIASLAQLVATFYATSLVFVVVVLGTVARLAGFSIFRLIAYLKAELLLVLGTSSSESALPALMEKLERAGCPKTVVGLVIPTGYSFNLDGTTLYLSLASVFVAQLAGVQLSMGQQLMMMLTLMLASKGVAGVPRGALVVLTGMLTQFGLPLEGAAILLGIDQVLDMGRTGVNVMGNCIATAVVARWEGVFDDEKMRAFVEGRESA